MSRNYYEPLSKLSTDENPQKQLSGTSKSKHLTYYAKIQQTNETPIKALIFLDSGASGNYIAEPFLRKHNIQKQPKKNPYTLRSLDGKPIGKDGQVTHKIVPLTLTAHEHSEQIKLEPTLITRYNIVLGIPWLNKHDPDIYYRTGQISFR